MQQIILDNSPNQNFDVTVNVNGKNTVFNLYLSYNTGHYWTIQIRDRYKNPITDNIPMLSGQNLLQGLGYLKIGELFLIKKSNVNEEIPNIDNIGVDYYLLWGDNR
jgi:hypothetical protein